MSGAFRGVDPVIVLINLVKKIENSWKYFLFYKELKNIKLEEIIEDVALYLKIDSEYERHYRKSYITPLSEGKKITLSRSKGENNVDPIRPREGNFVNLLKEFPRESTARITDCTMCNNGKVECPNCKGSKVVTCPECYTYRGGNCKKCKGTGKVPDPRCNGTGICQTCHGSGKIECKGCNGTGFVTVVDRIYETCPSCKGSGKVNSYQCSKCGGSGKIIKTIERQEQHLECRGTGKINCPECNGTGRCPRCSGTGKITCSNCRGTGVCPFCNGSGIKTCPTCVGFGYVICPICKGDSRLFLYTSDVYVYKHVKDDKEIFPPLFNQIRQSIDFDSDIAITLNELTDREVVNKLGLLNKYIIKTLKKAEHAFSNLLNNAKRREFIYTIKASDQTWQDLTLRRAIEIISINWKKQSNDNYYAKFKLSLHPEERTLKHDDTYNKLIFQKRLFRLLPLSLVSLWIGNKKRSLWIAGTKEKYVLEPPKFNLSWTKIILISSLTSVISYTILSKLLGYATSNDIYLWMLIGFLSVGYVLSVLKTAKTEKEKLITVFGTNDAHNLLFSSLLAHYISYEKMGVIRDKIYTKLSEYLLKDLKLGSSLSYSVLLLNPELKVKKIRLVNLSFSSYNSLNRDVKDLISNSNALILIIDPCEEFEIQLKRAKSLLQNFEGRFAIIMKDAKDINIKSYFGDHVTATIYNIDLEKLKENYLKGDIKAVSDIIEPFKWALGGKE